MTTKNTSRIFILSVFSIILLFSCSKYSNKQRQKVPDIKSGILPDGTMRVLPLSFELSSPRIQLSFIETNTKKPLIPQSVYLVNVSDGKQDSFQCLTPSLELPIGETDPVKFEFAFKAGEKYRVKIGFKSEPVFQEIHIPKELKSGEVLTFPVDFDILPDSNLQNIFRWDLSQLPGCYPGGNLEIFLLKEEMKLSTLFFSGDSGKQHIALSLPKNMLGAEVLITAATENYKGPVFYDQSLDSLNTIYPRDADVFFPMDQLKSCKLIFDKRFSFYKQIYSYSLRSNRATKLDLLETRHLDSLEHSLTFALPLGTWYLYANRIDSPPVYLGQFSFSGSDQVIPFPFSEEQLVIEGKEVRLR